MSLKGLGVTDATITAVVVVAGEGREGREWIIV